MKNKSRILLLLLVIFVAGLSLSALFLKRNNIGTETLKTELEKRINDLSGFQFRTEEINGNPVTGFTLKNINIESGDGTRVIKASFLKVGFEKQALLKGKLHLSNLYFRDARFDVDMLTSVLSRYQADQMPNSENFLSRMEFENCSFSSGSSLLEVKDLVVKIPSTGQLHGEGKAILNGMDFEADIIIVKDDNSFAVEKMDITSGATLLSLSGTAGKDLDLAGKFSTPDLSFISKLIPKTVKARLKGGVNTDLTITGPFKTPLLEGSLSARDFSVARFRFDKGRASWKFFDRTLSFSNIDSLVFGSPVSGDIDIIFTGGPLESLLKLSGRDLNVADWYTPLPWLDFATGRLDNIEVNLKGPFKKLSGSVSFHTGKGAVIQGHPFEKLSADLELNNGKDLNLRANGTWYKANIKGEGSIHIVKPASYLDMSFETKDLDIHQMKNRYPVVGSLDLQGTLAGKAILKGYTNDLKISGSFGSDKARLQEHLLQDLRFSFLNTGEETKVENLETKWMGSSFKGKGRLLDINGKSPRGEMTLSSPGVKAFKTLDIKNINSSGTFENGILSLKSFTSDLAGGKLNLSGQVKFPEESSPCFDLKGKSTGMKIQNLAADLGVPLNIKGKVDSVFSILGSPSAPEVAATLDSSGLSINGLPLKAAKASIKARDGKLFIKGMKADLAGSPLRSSGTIKLLDEDKDTLDLRTTIESLDLFSLTEKAFPDLPVSGVVSTDITITGVLKHPEISMSVSSKTFNLGGLTFDGLELETRLGENREEPVEYLLRTYTGDTPLEITGTVATKKESGLEITFESTGRDLDAEKLTEKIMGNLKSTLQGNFNFTCKGKITGHSIRGEGKLTSSKMTIQGYNMNNLVIPFTLKGNKMISKGASAGIYGGNALMEGSLDMDKAKWEMGLILKDADLARFSRDFREFKVNSTGKGDLEIALSGVLDKVYLLSGTGSMALREGTVGGFDALKSLTQDGILKYRNLNTCFNLDGGNVYLLPGSRVSAYPDDKVYKYLSFSGALGGPHTNMDLKCSGQINTQALNALQGVIQGIVRSGNGGDANLLLQDFLSGLVGGYSGPDFRKINFELVGTWSKPALYSLEIDNSTTSASSIPQDDDPGMPNQKEIKFEVSIPTGEGTDTSESAGDQFKKQVMENLLKQIFIDEDAINSGSSN